MHNTQKNTSNFHYDFAATIPLFNKKKYTIVNKNKLINSVCNSKWIGEVTHLLYSFLATTLWCALSAPDPKNNHFSSEFYYINHNALIKYNFSTYVQNITFWNSVFISCEVIKDSMICVLMYFGVFLLFRIQKIIIFRRNFTIQIT